MSAVTQWCADYFAPLNICQAEPVQLVSREEETSCYIVTACKTASYFLIVIPFILALVWGFSAFIDWATEAIEEATDPLAQRVPVDYIGWREWSAHVQIDHTGLFFRKFPPLSREEIRDLRTLFDREIVNHAGDNAKIRDNMGVTILEIPEGVTPVMLIYWLRHCGVHVAIHDSFQEDILNRFGHIATSEPYRIAITNSDIPVSGFRSFASQQRLLKEVGLEHPKLVEMLALLFFRERGALPLPYYHQITLNESSRSRVDLSQSRINVYCAEQLAEEVPVGFQLASPKELRIHSKGYAAERNHSSCGAAKRI